MSLGRVETHNMNEDFCMTVLALKNSRRANAVSSLHGQVSRTMWVPLYPGRPDHPNHEVAAKQMRRFGGMVSARFGTAARAEQVCNTTKVFTLAESLGGIESLIEHPGRMTHASVAGSALEVPDDLVRLSVGIETADDLLADLEEALGRL